MSGQRSFCYTCKAEITFIADKFSGGMRIAYDGYIWPRIVNMKRHSVHICKTNVNKTEGLILKFTGKKRVLIRELVSEGKNLFDSGVNLSGAFGQRTIRQILIDGPDSVTLKELEKWVKNLSKIKAALDSGWFQK